MKIALLSCLLLIGLSSCRNDNYEGQLQTTKKIVIENQDEKWEIPAANWPAQIKILDSKRIELKLRSGNKDIVTQLSSRKNIAPDASGNFTIPSSHSRQKFDVTGRQSAQTTSANLGVANVSCILGYESGETSCSDVLIPGRCTTVEECGGFIPGHEVCRDVQECRDGGISQPICREVEECSADPGHEVCETVQECGENALGETICKDRQSCQNVGGGSSCATRTVCDGGSSIGQICETRRICEVGQPVRDCRDRTVCEPDHVSEQCHTPRIPIYGSKRVETVRTTETKTLALQLFEPGTRNSIGSFRGQIQKSSDSQREVTSCR